MLAQGREERGGDAAASFAGAAANRRDGRGAECEGSRGGVRIKSRDPITFSRRPSRTPALSLSSRPRLVRAGGGARDDGDGRRHPRGTLGGRRQQCSRCCHGPRAATVTALTPLLPPPGLCLLLPSKTLRCTTHLACAAHQQRSALPNSSPSPHFPPPPLSTLSRLPIHLAQTQVAVKAAAQEVRHPMHAPTLHSLTHSHPTHAPFPSCSPPRCCFELHSMTNGTLPCLERCCGGSNGTALIKCLSVCNGWPVALSTRWVAVVFGVTEEANTTATHGAYSHSPAVGCCSVWHTLIHLLWVAVVFGILSFTCPAMSDTMRGGGGGGAAEGEVEAEVAQQKERWRRRWRSRRRGGGGGGAAEGEVEAEVAQLPTQLLHSSVLIRF
ncbi:unnamed protein product [Closterium sp. Yama58-4]|nr:unnamed protein product [Closterium sp. Yama58-4]